MALLYSALVLGTTTTKASTSIVKHKLPVLVVYNVLKEVLGGVIFVKLIAIMAMHGRLRVLNQSKELLKYLTYISSRSFVQIGCGVGRAYGGRGDLGVFATCRILECYHHSRANNFL